MRSFGEFWRVLRSGGKVVFRSGRVVLESFGEFSGPLQNVISWSFGEFWRVLGSGRVVFRSGRVVLESFGEFW